MPKLPFPVFCRPPALVRMIIAGSLLVTLGGCKGTSLTFPQSPEGLNGPSLLTASGTAFDGPITGGSVAVGQYQPDGSLLPLGTVTTDHNGNFAITTLFDPSGGPVSFTLTGGSTLDTASGATVTFTTGESLTTLIPAADITRATIVLTPFSSLEATQALTLMAQGSAPEAALTQARGDWNQFLGFDPAEVPPANLLSGPASANASGIYGLLLAGLSELTNHIGTTQHLAPGTANPMGLLSLLEEDEGDALFNGLAPGNPTPLTYYGYTLSPETLRQDVTAEALIFLWSGQNQSGLTPALTDGILNGIALNTGPLFPPSPSPSVPDPGTPTVAITNPASGLYYNGTITVTASATDSLGIAQMVMTGQNVVFPGGSVSGNPIITPLDTTKSTSGPASLSATATDYAGNSRTATVAFIIDNTPPVLSNLSPANGSVYAPGCTGTLLPVTVTGTLTDSLSGPEGVKATEVSPLSQNIGVTYSTINSTTGTFSFTFTVPANGCKSNPITITINGYDNLRNTTTLNYTLSVTN